MKYWEDMQDKWGFNDGDAVPAEARAARIVYIQAVNAVAARRGSKFRCSAYNRSGMHNSLIIVKLTLEQFSKLTPAQVLGDEDYDVPDRGEPIDDQFQAAVAECEETHHLDQYVIVNPTVCESFAPFLEELRTMSNPPEE